MDRKWKLGDDLYPEDSLLDNIFVKVYNTYYKCIIEI